MLLTFLAYAVGAGGGLLVDRGGPRLHRDWPIYLRAQILSAAFLLTLFSAWRLSAPHQIVAPVVIAGVGWVLLGSSLVTRGERSRGQAALESWAANPNGLFWVLPMAGALAGPSGTGVTALANAAFTAPNAVNIHLMRAEAPIAQRRATHLVDQSALLALLAGLLLHLAGPAPGFSALVLRVAGPLMAFVGAAIFVGSLLHPHNLSVGRGDHGVRRMAGLSLVRVVWLVPLAVLSSSKAVTVVALLAALGAPAFNPSQLAVLYGYRSAVVNAAVRWGWFLLPVGLVAAWAVT